jgi:flagellin
MLTGYPSDNLDEIFFTKHFPGASFHFHEIDETSYSKGNFRMANIGATTAFYKVETSLTRANNEVSKSMERLATGKQNANAGDRSSYVAMSDTFRLDYVGTKAGIKGASVVLGYLETGMRTLDAASGLLSRLQELAVLGANATNTTADHEAINLEAEAIAKEFNRLMTTSKYKGKEMFVTSAGSEYVSLGGRDAEMTFGIGDITYAELYASDRTISGGPNDGETFKLTHLPSDAVASKNYSTATDQLVAGATYEIISLGTESNDTTAGGDAQTLKTGDAATTTAGASLGGTIAAGDQILIGSSNVTLSGDMILKRVSGTNALTEDIEAIQAKVNTARVQAGSQYAALESAIGYTTDLTAQYELGFNTVNDVNFSMETAHLAKNQILQQAATAMLAQANSGQQSLLQLIQG